MIIYVIDDETLLRHMSEQTIRQAAPGAEIVSFPGPRQVLAAFKERKPDIIFTDIDMPRMTGLELAQEIRRADTGIRIAFVTAFTKHEVPNYNAPGKGLILKPISFEAVREELKAASSLSSNR